MSKTNKLAEIIKNRFDTGRPESIRLEELLSGTDYLLRETIGDVTELKNNIKKYGQKFPIFVRAEGKGYKVISGYRRVQALHDLKFDYIDAVVLNVEADEAEEIALIEGFHSKGLTAWEKAKAVKILYEKGKKQKEIAELLGKSLVYVESSLRVFRIDNIEIRKSLKQGKLDLFKAVILNKLPDNFAVPGWKKEEMDKTNFVKEVVKNKLSRNEIKKVLKEHKKIKIELPALEGISEMDCLSAIDVLKNELTKYQASLRNI